MDGQSCWETDLRQPLALIIGGEAEGASESAQKIGKSENQHSDVWKDGVVECRRGRVSVDV